MRRSEFLPRRVLLLVLIGLVLAGSVWAQETTWTNPKTTAEALLPRSMLSVLTSGLWYDEIDTIVLSPAELSNYKGVGLFTAYSNFDTPIAPAVNPFVAAAIPYGNYLVGVTMPMGNFRMGAFAGVQFASGALLNAPIVGAVTGVDSTRDFTSDTLGTVGTADWTDKTTIKATGVNSRTKFAAATGIDLGFMGLSLLANIQNNVDTIGGTMHYTWTKGSDAAFTTGLNTITDYWGLLGKSNPASPADASNVTYIHGDPGVPPVSKWYLAATGELPLPNLPITARIGAGGATNASAAVPFTYPYTQVWTVINPTGAASATDTRSGYTIGGLAPGGTLTFFTNQPGDGSAQDVTALALPAVAASDPANFNDVDFYGRLGGYVDPSFKLSDIISLKVRGGVDYMLDSINFNPATIRERHFTNTTGGTGTFDETRTLTDPQLTLTNNIDVDLGGAFVFTDPTKFLTAQVGFFYIPSFNFQSTSHTGNAVSSTVTSYSESAPTTADATAATVAVGPGLARGTITATTTTAYTGGSGVNTLTHRFNLPVAVRLNIIPDKVQLIGAYQLDQTYTVTTSWANAHQTSVGLVTTVQNAAGTTVSPAAPAVSATDTVTNASTTVEANVGWAGTPQFMVRWTPLPQMTVDLWGQTIMTAINQGILVFNPNTFISSLGLNVSFRF